MSPDVNSGIRTVIGLLGRFKKFWWWLSGLGAVAGLSVAVVLIVTGGDDAAPVLTGVETPEEAQVAPESELPTPLTLIEIPAAPAVTGGDSEPPAPQAPGIPGPPPIPVPEQPPPSVAIPEQTVAAPRAPDIPTLDPTDGAGATPVPEVEGRVPVPELETPGLESTPEPVIPTPEPTPEPVLPAPEPTPVVPSLAAAVACDLSVIIDPKGAGYVEVEGSRVPPAGEATAVTCNEQIGIVARPTDANEWMFSQWEGDITGFQAVQIARIDSPQIVRAVFGSIEAPLPTPAPLAITHQLVINESPVTSDTVAVPNGNIRLSPGPTESDFGYLQDTLVILSPEPDPYFVFQGWTGACEGTGSCVLTQDGLKEVSAVFVRRLYSLTASATEGGSVDPLGVSNQQKWDTLGAERSGAGWRSGELPEGPVVASSPFGGLSLHLLPAL